MQLCINVAITMNFVLAIGLCVLTIIVSVFVYIALQFKYVPAQKRRLLDDIPGPKPFPIIGNALEFFAHHDDLLGVFENFHKKYGGIMKYIIGGRPSVIVSNYEDIEVILSSFKHIDKSDIYRFLHPWLGKGLLTSTGQKWHSRRKLLTSAFHFKILEESVPVVNRNVKVVIEKFKPYCDTGVPIDIHSFISLCSLAIICETAMGVSVNAQQIGSKYVNTIKRMSYLINYRTLHPWLWPDVLFSLSPTGWEHKKCLKVLHGFTNKVIQDRKMEYTANGPKEASKKGRKVLAFLDSLIELSVNEGLLNDSDIREEVNTFMFEGHDTVSTSISWTLYLLGLHPNIQEKAYGEIQEIFGDSDQESTWDDLQKMKYLEQIIKESMRMYPSVPLITREISVDIHLGKYTIPAGTEILFFSYFIHRNEEVFPEPEKFNPDRFLPEECAKRHPFAYIPFSAGPRNCIGQRFAMMEEKIILSSILRNFRLESSGCKEDLTLLLDVILKPKEPLMIKFYSRH